MGEGEGEGGMVMVSRVGPKLEREVVGAEVAPWPKVDMIVRERRYKEMDAR